MKQSPFFPLSSPPFRWLIDYCKEGSINTIALLVVILFLALLQYPAIVLFACLAIVIALDLVFMALSWPLIWFSNRQFALKEAESSRQHEREMKQIDSEVQEERKRKISENRTRAEAVRFCEQARLECELLYDRHASELAGRLPRDRIISYFQTYMPLDGEPDEVRERASMLKDMIADNLGMAGVGNNEAASMEDIANAFRQKREDLKQLGTDDETRQSMLASLKMQEREAIRKAIEVNL